MDASALLPFPLQSVLPILFSYHMHLITHHTPLPSSTHTSRFPTFPSPTPSSRILSPLYPSATLSQHPSFLLPPPSPFLSPSSTRPHLSLSPPQSHPIFPPPLLSPCVSNEVIGSHFPPIPDLHTLSFQLHSISHPSLLLSIPPSRPVLLERNALLAPFPFLTPLKSSSPSSSRNKYPSHSFAALRLSA